MKYKYSLQELLYTHGTGQAAGRARAACIRLGLAALMLVTLAAYLALSGPTRVATAAPPDTHTERAFLAANPEVMFARRYYAAGMPTDVKAAFLAANPEVMLVRRYVSPSSGVADHAAFLAANPEVMFARRYAAATSDVAAEAAFLAANPELLLARR
jgi:hypothetical protein